MKQHCDTKIQYCSHWTSCGVLG